MKTTPLEDSQLDPPELPESSNRPPRRKLFNLTGMGARIAATVVAIGLGVVIISYALRPSTPTPTPTPSDANNNNEQVAEAATTEPTATIAQEEVIATFTPGATSTPPPPPATATAEPAAATAPAAPAEEQPVVDPNTPGELVIGGQAKVSGTDGFGVNMRQESSLTAAVVEILLEETTLELIGGPTEAAGYTWWQVRLSDGREGWVVQDFIAP